MQPQLSGEGREWQVLSAVGHVPWTRFVGWAF